MSSTPYYLNSAGVKLMTGGIMSWSNDISSITWGNATSIYDYIDWAGSTVLNSAFQNITLNYGGQSVVGNAKDNILTAGTGNERLSGGGGNDVFVSSGDAASADTFVINKQDAGSNMIYGFKTAIDSIILTNFTNFRSFGDVQKNLLQVGANAVLTLGNGSTLTLANTAVSSLTVNNFGLPENLTGLSLSFDDEFSSFSGSPNGVGTIWKENNGRTLASNHEAEYYSDPSVGMNPFSDSNGVLTITAQRQQGSNALNLPWDSGEITTNASFSQEYGVFEMRAELPAGQGMWPAFWLLPENGSWPPEIDVMEMLGNSPNTTYSTVHAVTGTTGTGGVVGADASVGFHTYAVDWEPNTITFYVDGNAVGVEQTPAGFNLPMYMIANLAVGGAGSWPGATDGTTPAVNNMQIDYIRAYATANTVNISGSAALATMVDTLTLTLSEDAYAGDAQFVVSVDGKIVSSTQTVTALHSQNQTQSFTYTGEFGSGAHTIGVTFLNDAYAGAGKDRNLYVNSISLDNNTTTENYEQNNTGLANYTIGALATVTGTNANDVLTGNSTTNLLIGNGGSDTYVMRTADQTDTIVNGIGSASAAAGILSEDVSSNKLWFAKSGNDLVIDTIGTTQQAIIRNWYSGGQPLNQIVDNGNLKLDSGLQNLVQSMASFSAANPAFNPQATGVTMPTDNTLSAVLAASWHS